MTERSRRGFLRNASVGAGVVVAATLAPQASAEATGEVSGAGPASGDPVMAYVRDARVGEIALFVGSEEFVYRDADLARRLARAVHQARPA
jgi:3-hydroxyisobutyrate dehydrogenase-like beta-hydroxyacid dehydrogenase